MSSLSKALEEYLSIRRGLGFKLKEEGKVLVDFVSFLNEKGTSYITTELAWIPTWGF